MSPENLLACRHVPDHPGFRRRAAPFHLIILLALSPILAQAADSPTTLVPQPVYEHQPAPSQYEVSRQLPPDQPNAAPLFFAVVSRDWPAGLVPLFGVHKESQFDLRRRPRPGREPSSDPLFFARPMTNDIATSKLSGRWDCQSVDADGTRNDYGWDFALEGTNVAGRFDPDTDYRFAYVMGGGFVSNQFHVNGRKWRNPEAATGKPLVPVLFTKCRRKTSGWFPSMNGFTGKPELEGMPLGTKARAWIGSGTTHPWAESGSQRQRHHRIVPKRPHPERHSKERTAVSEEHQHHRSAD
jgi:hypothetical protein